MFIILWVIHVYYIVGKNMFLQCGPFSLSFGVNSCGLTIYVVKMFYIINLIIIIINLLLISFQCIELIC